MIADLHFLRPYWLLALLLLPVLVWLLRRRGGAGGAWERVVDASLQPYVLSSPTESGSRGWALAALALGVLLAVLALAGPVWHKLPQPVYRAQTALVVALDLSRSMDAPDVSPSRLARARQELIDILERRDEGQTALIAYASQAFVVSPLTTDAATIRAMVSALGTDIMPAQGSRADRALDKAAAIMHQAGVATGDILLITDDAGSGDASRVAERLREQGMRISVLGVGTPAGAPVPVPGGGLLKGPDGQIVLPRLEEDRLRALALAGGGRYSRLQPDDRDLESLFEHGEGSTLLASDEPTQLETDLWREEGPWLLLPLLPLAALAFRRGWLAVVLLSCLPWTPAAALDWPSLWQRPDQRGLLALENGEAEKAAEFFEDPEWKAAALYRAGEFAGAAELLDGLDATRALYNRGNALARSGQIPAAVDAYQQVLERDPGHEDARYNLELLLQQSSPQQSPSQSQSDAGEQGPSAAPDSGAAQTPQGEGESQTPRDRERGGEHDPDRGQRQPMGDAGDDETGTDGAKNDAESRDTETSRVARSPSPEQAEAVADAPVAEDDEQREQSQATEQWLRRIPDDPGGLLRRKFLYQYRRMQPPSEESEPAW